MKKQITMLILFCVLVFSALQANAAVKIVDSSQQDLRAINAVPGVPVIPVGTIMAWGSGNNGSFFSLAQASGSNNFWPHGRIMCSSSNLI